jgi:hypothetical protein
MTRSGNKSLVFAHPYECLHCGTVSVLPKHPDFCPACGKAIVTVDYVEGPPQAKIFNLKTLSVGDVLLN